MGAPALGQPPRRWVSAAPTHAEEVAIAVVIAAWGEEVVIDLFEEEAHALRRHARFLA